MRPAITQHVVSIVIITLVMLVAVLSIEGVSSLHIEKKETVSDTFSTLPTSSLSDSFEHALYSDCMNLFYPGRQDSNEVILNTIYRAREDRLNSTLTSSFHNQKLTPESVISIAKMYISFCIVYIIVMLLTYYGVQTLGTLRFILRQQHLYRTTHRAANTPIFGLIVLNAAKVCAYLILFSPAYVIAYSIRTEFNTDSTIFMILLGVISNGLLVMYTNKFYTFLVTESRKGYIENALVKNLSAIYTFSPKRGIPLRAIFSLKKKFPGHIFEHIFKNARFQYLSTIKEQASFLITGLVIIEMALNIHGHLTYELLRQLLYQNYSHVLIIMLFIFYTVKATDILADTVIYREAKHYENR